MTEFSIQVRFVMTLTSIRTMDVLKIDLQLTMAMSDCFLDTLVRRYAETDLISETISEMMVIPSLMMVAAIFANQKSVASLVS